MPYPLTWRPMLEDSPRPLVERLLRVIEHVRECPALPVLLKIFARDASHWHRLSLASLDAGGHFVSSDLQLQTLHLQRHNRHVIGEQGGKDAQRFARRSAPRAIN